MYQTKSQLHVLPFQPVDHVTPLMRRTAFILYTSAKARDGLFGSRLFADPAWNILLDLIVWQGVRRLSVSDACLGARTPHATAMRYLTELIGRGLVVRNPDPTDGRRNFVELSSRGVALMGRALHPFDALCADQDPCMNLGFTLERHMAAQDHSTRLAGQPRERCGPRYVRSMLDRHRRDRARCRLLGAVSVTMLSAYGQEGRPEFDKGRILSPQSILPEQPSALAGGFLAFGSVRMAAPDTDPLLARPIRCL